MENEKFQRSIKGFLIYPKFQMSLVLINTFVMVTVCLAIYWGVRTGYQTLELEGMTNNIPESHPYFKFLSYQSSLIYQHLFFCFGIGLIISNLAIIFVSHKVAGPIVRLKNYFIQMKETKLVSEVHFRKDDFFDELPSIVNEALNSIKKEEKKEYLKKVD